MNNESWKYIQIKLKMTRTNASLSNHYNFVIIHGKIVWITGDSSFSKLVCHWFFNFFFSLSPLAMLSIHQMNTYPELTRHIKPHIWTTTIIHNNLNRITIALTTLICQIASIICGFFVIHRHEAWVIVVCSKCDRTRSFALRFFFFSFSVWNSILGIHRLAWLTM